LTETKTKLPGAGMPSMPARLDLLLRQQEPAWLDWRAKKMTAMYCAMRDEVVRRRAGAKLYLTTANLLGGRQLQPALRPVLPPQANAGPLLKALGLDVPRLADEGIVVPRPQRISASSSPELRDQDRYW